MEYVYQRVRERYRDEHKLTITYIGGEFPMYVSADSFWGYHDVMYDNFRGGYHRGATRPMVRRSLAVVDGVGADPSGPHRLGWFGPIQVRPWPVGMHPDVLYSLLPSISDGAWYDFGLDAFIEFNTQVEEEVGLYNFIAESKEIVDIIPQILKSLSKLISSSVGAWRGSTLGRNELYASAAYRLQRVKPAHLLDELADLASSGVLFTSFALKPTIDDIGALTNLTTRVTDSIKKLKDQNGKATALYFGRKGPYELPVIKPTVEYWWNSGYRWKFTLDTYESKFKAGSILLQALDGLDTLDGTVRAFIVALGLHNPLGAVYNGIPFTFVVDWVLKLGRLFDYWTAVFAKPFKGTWDLQSSYTALRETATVKAELAVDWWGTWDLKPVPLNFTMTRYQRIPEIPVKPFDFEWRDLNPSQLLLANSLLFQRAR